MFKHDPQLKARAKKLSKFSERGSLFSELFRGAATSLVICGNSTQKRNCPIAKTAKYLLHMAEYQASDRAWCVLSNLVNKDE